MTHRALSRLLFFGISISMLGLRLASAADIDVKNLPKTVTETILARYPKAELTEARKIVEDNKDVYEVDLMSDKKIIEIAVFPDGKIDWVAMDLPINSLPKRVLAALHKKYPAAKLNHASTIYTVSDGKDHLEHYQIEITTKAGKKRDLDISPVGEIEEDEAVKD